MCVNSSRNHITRDFGAEIPVGHQRSCHKNTLLKIAAGFVLFPKGSGVRLPDLGRQVSEQRGEDQGLGPGGSGPELRVPSVLSPESWGPRVGASPGSPTRDQ